MCMLAKYQLKNMYSIKLVDICTFEEKKTAKNICAWVVNKMKDLKFDFNKFRGLTTDGAKNMSSNQQGLRNLLITTIRQLTTNPMTLNINEMYYQNCADHRLNLITKDLIHYPLIRKYIVFIKFL